MSDQTLTSGVRAAQASRLQWIVDEITAGRPVTRAGIVAVWGVSPTQATIDLRLVRQRMPGLMCYDIGAKVYVAGAEFPRSTPGGLAGEIKAYREAMGLSQAALADRWSVSVRTIQGWERGRGGDSAGLVRRLIKIDRA